MTVFTNLVLEEWLCPDCTPQRHLEVEESSGDVDASDCVRVLNRQSLHHWAAESKKTPAFLNAKSERKKRPAPPLRSGSPRNPEVSRDKEEQRQSGPEQPKSSKKQDKIWTAHEKDLVRLLMEEVINEQQVNLTEKKWEVISDRLASRFGFIRSKTSIKNYWSRQGRAQTRVDERRNPNPEKLITSVQNPYQRKQARQGALKRKNPGEEGSGYPNRSRAKRSDEGEADDDDDYKGRPPTKRRRNR